MDRKHDEKVVSEKDWKLLPEDPTLDKSRDLRLNDAWYVVGDVNETDSLDSQKYERLKMGEFDSCLGFWQFWNCFEFEDLKKRLPQDVNIRMIRKRVGLDYGDEHFKNGGAWNIEFCPEKLEEVTKLMVLAVVSEAFGKRNASDVIGVALSKHMEDWQLKLYVSKYEIEGKFMCNLVLGSFMRSCSFKEFVPGTARSDPIPAIEITKKRKMKQISAFETDPATRVCPPILESLRWSDFYQMAETPHILEADPAEVAKSSEPQTNDAIINLTHQDNVEFLCSLKFRNMIMKNSNVSVFVDHNLLVLRGDPEKTSEVKDMIESFRNPNPHKEHSNITNEKLKSKKSSMFVTIPCKSKAPELSVPTNEHCATELCETKSYVVFLRGLPFDVKSEDVEKELLDDFPCIAIHLTNDKKGRRTGHGFIEFKTEEERASVIEKQNGSVVNGRYIEMFKSCQASLVSALNNGQRRNGRILHKNRWRKNDEIVQEVENLGKTSSVLTKSPSEKRTEEASKDSLKHQRNDLGQLWTCDDWIVSENKLAEESNEQEYDFNQFVQRQDGEEDHYLLIPPRKVSDEFEGDINMAYRDLIYTGEIVGIEGDLNVDCRQADWGSSNICSSHGNEISEFSHCISFIFQGFAARQANTIFNANAKVFVPKMDCAIHENATPGVLLAQ